MAALWVCFSDATTRIVYDVERYFHFRRRPSSPRRSHARRMSAIFSRASEPKTQISSQLFRWLRARDPEEAPGRAWSADGGRARGRSPVDRQRLDHLQQQGQTCPAIRAVLQRLASISSSTRFTASARFSSTIRSSASSPRCIPNNTYEKVVFDPWQQIDLGCQRHRRFRS